MVFYSLNRIFASESETKTLMSIWVFFKLIGSLALLMFGMKSMSEALQKMAGSQLRNVLQAMTTNRFTGMFTGAFVTAAVQSSTATTVMTVSFVNAGLLTLAQSISIIMGANIGTTFTAWIMSAGFSFNITDFVWPAFFIGLLLIYSKNKRIIGDFLFGISFLLLGLGTLKATGTEMHLENVPAVMNFFQSFDDNYLSYIIFLIIGGIMTVCVQSSAAVMAITMTLCSTGVLPIYLGIALVMGENIGTTVTSNVAALTANTQARRAAFAHMFFNIFGVIWVLCIFRYFINMVCGMVGYNPAVPNPTLLPFVLATFHTTFNVLNTAILIWFIPQIEAFVCKVITNNNQEEDEFRLKFISSGILSTPELSILEAKKEISNFATRCHKMFGFVNDLLTTTKDEEFNKLFSRIEKYENITDNMEAEIANYLTKVSEGHLSDDSKARITRMMRQIDELESIGDSCYHLARTINRRRKNAKQEYTPEQMEHINAMMVLVEGAMDNMEALINHPDSQGSQFLKARNIENEINNFRSHLKGKNFEDVNAGKYPYQLGVYYIDYISECEKLGDYIMNVNQASNECAKNK